MIHPNVGAISSSYLVHIMSALTCAVRISNLLAEIGLKGHDNQPLLMHSQTRRLSRRKLELYLN